jgi:dipeptidyl aminopeptidase/acylaminoacyl peptidase
VSRVPATMTDRHESERSARRHVRHRVGLVGCVIGLVGIVSSCALAAPGGPAPLRYRDVIFSDPAVKTADVTYGTAPNIDGSTATLKADVFRPPGDTVTSRPLIVWVHGGGFRAGSKTSPEIVDEASTFARKGYVTVSIDYRLSAGCAPITSECVQGIFNSVEDAKTAVRFFKANATTYGIDPTRVAIGGSSAGAIIAMGVGYGVQQSGTPNPASKVQAAVSLSGGVIFTGSIDANDSPALLFHGDADTIVPYATSQDTVDVAHAVGAEAYLIDFVGAGHVPYAQNRQRILDTESNFIYHKLNAGGAAR